jgi:hypothetical protein
VRHAAVVAVAVLLWRAQPGLFAWDATGFRTFLVFTVLIAVVTVIPGRGHGG